MSEDINTWIPFAKEYKFAAEVIVRDQDLVFWAMPFSEEIEGVKSAREMIAEMDTINYRENPFLVRFSLAGIKYAYNKSTAVSPLIEEVETYLSKERGPAYIRCKGYYSSDRIARCVIDYENLESEQEALLSLGYLALIDDPVDVPGDHLAQLRKASENAKAEERGIWAPFFFMLQDMQGGQ